MGQASSIVGLGWSRLPFFQKEPVAAPITTCRYRKRMVSRTESGEFAFRHLQESK